MIQAKTIAFDGLNIARDMAGIADTKVRQAFLETCEESLPAPYSDKNIALTALGSYAREEMVQGSDIDYMLAFDLPDEIRAKDIIKTFSDNLSHKLTNHVAPHHAAATLDACTFFAEHEGYLADQIRQPRFITGNASVFTRLITQSTFPYVFEVKNARSVCHYLWNIWDYIRLHAKYNQSKNTLPINIKSSLGMTSTILLSSIGGCLLYSIDAVRHTNTMQVLSAMKTKGKLTEAEYNQQMEALNFYLHIRNELNTMKDPSSRANTITMNNIQKLADRLEFKTPDILIEKIKYHKDNVTIVYKKIHDAFEASVKEVYGRIYFEMLQKAGKPSTSKADQLSLYEYAKTKGSAAAPIIFALAWHSEHNEVIQAINDHPMFLNWYSRYALVCNPHTPQEIRDKLGKEDNTLYRRINKKAIDMSKAKQR